VTLGSTTTAVAFWLGTLLPLVYLPVMALGLDSPLRLLGFLALLVLNVIALAVGREYPEMEPRAGR